MEKEFERDYDVHETGHIELSGMTWNEYVEWALAQENNVQPYIPRKEIWGIFKEKTQFGTKIA